MSSRRAVYGQVSDIESRLALPTSRCCGKHSGQKTGQHSTRERASEREGNKKIAASIFPFAGAPPLSLSWERAQVRLCGGGGGGGGGGRSRR